MSASLRRLLGRGSSIGANRAIHSSNPGLGKASAADSAGFGAISGTDILLRCGSIYLDAIFADDGEGVQHVGGARRRRICLPRFMSRRCVTGFWKDRWVLG